MGGVLYEMHMHTPLCNHARGEPQAYAAVAAVRNLAGIVVTCHNPTNDGWSPNVRMSVDEFDDYVTIVDEARQEWAGRVDVRLGMESDYVPGQEAWLEQLHGMAELHHVLGSVHPQLPQYQERFFHGDALAFQRTYFEHLALAAETGLFDTLSHPDLVKNSFPAQWDVEQILDVICASLDRIAATETAMELNTSGRQKLVQEMNPGPQILQQMQLRGIPVVIGADAHDPRRVAADFELALDALSAAGYTHTSYFLGRQRRDIPLDVARASLCVGQNEGE
ncbi:MAG TPA: histidinol-phosphatase HisJ family protein [Candidatus Handelsmanbacteria bacterium]|nr:histidinol-phosphatase HisJ family protein [Candidatus Handelsmanbacteria bacterium]